MPTRTSVLPPGIALLMLLLEPTAGTAQERTLAQLTSTPEEVAAIFLRSVRAIRWGAATRGIPRIRRPPPPPLAPSTPPAPSPPQPSGRP